MSYWKSIAAMLWSLLVLACGGEDQATAQKAVHAVLESDATRFGKFTLVSNNYACLTFKDSEDVGYQQAYLRRNLEGWSVIISYVADHDECIEATKQMLSKNLSVD